MLELALVAALVVAQDEPPLASPEAPDEYREPAAGGSDYSLANAHHADVGGGFTKVTVLHQHPTPHFGWFPVIVHVDNTLGPRQTLRLSYTSTGAGGNHTFTRSVEVAAGERRAVSLPVPSHLRYGDLRVRGPGVTEKGSQRVYFNAVTVRQRAVMNVGTPESFQAAVGAAPSYSGNANVQVFTVAPDEAPGELTSYIGWDAVVLSGARFEQLAEAQRRALEAYAASGGHLVVMQSARGLASAFPLLAADTGGYGLGQLTFCERCGPARALAHVSRVPVRAIEPKGRRNRYDYDADATPELQLPVAKAPVGRFLVIIALFTLAIGPGSLWVARRKGPAALLVTIPGTALLTCALIIGYSLFRDGFTVHATVQGFSLLDSRTHRAVTASVAAFYANLAPGVARFDDGTVIVAPTVTREYASVEQAAGVAFDDGARVGADFIPSRSYVEWTLLSVAPTRARLVVQQQGRVVKVQNALGAEIELVELQLPDGRYTATSVKDGEEKVASPQPGRSTVELGMLDRRLSDAGRAALEAKLRPHEFLAVLKGPGLTGLGGLTLEHAASRHLVRGGFEP